MNTDLIIQSMKNHDFTLQTFFQVLPFSSTKNILC